VYKSQDKNSRYHSGLCLLVPICVCNLTRLQNDATHPPPWCHPCVDHCLIYVMMSHAAVIVYKCLLISLNDFAHVLYYTSYILFSSHTYLLIMSHTGTSIALYIHHNLTHIRRHCYKYAILHWKFYYDVAHTDDITHVHKQSHMHIIIVLSRNTDPLDVTHVHLHIYVHSYLPLKWYKYIFTNYIHHLF
jgi:hypothetical protein